MSKTSMNDKNLKGFFCAYMTAILYGGCTTVASMVMKGSINNVTLLFLRAAICAVVLAVVVFWGKRDNARPWDLYLRSFLLGALVYASQSAVYFAAVRNNPASLTTVIYSVYPVFVPFVVGFMNRSRPDLKTMPALGLAIIGLVLLLDVNMENFSVWGTALGILATVGFAVYVVLGSRIRRDGEELGPFEKTMCVMSGSAVSFCIFGILTGGLKLADAVPSLPGVALIAIVFTLAPMCFFWTAVSLLGPEKASIPSIFEPVSGIIMAMILLGERLTVLQFAGIAVIMLGLMFAQKTS